MATEALKRDPDGKSEDLALLYLSEEQNVAFDSEYHSEEEFVYKLRALGKSFAGGPKSFLDIGGGNGHFIDRMLAEFPEARGCIVDVSPQLLAKNQDNPRKEVVIGSIEDLPRLLGDRKFDVISMNWLLHHLVGPSHRRCIGNIRSALKLAMNALSERGVILIAENEYQGFFDTNVPSHVIYGITSIRNPAFVRVARRYFNTAGVGVCFQSRGSWLSIFERAGLMLEDAMTYKRWSHPWTKRLMMFGLFMKADYHGHYLLRPTGV